MLAAFSLAVVALPEFHAVVYSQALDVAINTGATIVAAIVAALAWGRYREGRQTAALYQSAAFATLATVNLLIVALIVLGIDDEFGLALPAPSEAPAWTWTLARLAAALLLLGGGVAAWRRDPPTQRHPRLLVVVPAVVLGVLLLVAPSLTWLPDVGIGPLVTWPAGRLPADVPPLDGLLVLAQASGAALFVAAAGIYLRLYRRDGQTPDGYLAVGMVVAAFSQLHASVLPVVYTGIVTTSDTLRVVFYAILLLGVEAGGRADLASLRRANADLARLREADALRAAMEERHRLAREVHDGLAQDLWFAKLKQSRQSQVPGLPAEAQELGREVGQAIDAALAEARQAVMAMRADRDDEEPLADVLARYVDDFGDRFGINAEFVPTGPMPHLSARTKAELLRIAQEALNNVRKHADATIVRIEAGGRDGRFMLGVVDNGRGFDPVRVPDDRVGLHSMRERAELVGATMDVTSAPSDGTRVEVSVPIEAEATA